MSQYLLSFAREHLTGKSEAYLVLLWCMYKANQEKGRYSDHIKAHLSSPHNDLVGKNYQRIAERFKRILDIRPEFNWVMPSGLQPLAYLQAKNFRGFGELGPDDKGTFLRFSKIKNIFYAPNGGGKTSLCEALEFAATGHIKEADRRKTKIRQYIARTEGGKPSVTLMGVNKMAVTRSLTWSSCFIDRNRLQEFSLLGSKDTGSAEGDVIATLFGLEELQEVISRFVKPESFNLKPLHKPDLTESISALNKQRADALEKRHGHELSIVAVNRQVCESLGLTIDQQDAVRFKYNRLLKLADFKIRKAERLKLAEAPDLVPLRKIQGAIGISRRLLLRKKKIEEELLEEVATLNYRALFEALEAIHNTGVADENCPACSTPLWSAVENPYQKARCALQAMGKLERLQAMKHRTENAIAHMAAELETRLSILEKNERAGVVCELSLDELKIAISIFHTATNRGEAAAQVLEVFVKVFTENSNAVRVYIEACEKRFKEVDTAAAHIKRLEGQAQSLIQTADSLKNLFGNKKALAKAFTEAGSALGDLVRQRLAQKSLDIDSTKYNSLLGQMQIEYGNLYRDLINYKLSLEKIRLAGIEAKAAEYYQAINDHDDEGERINALSFERVNESYRIIISNSTGARLDAFSVLSEGHLRALGLSVLLAMAEKNLFPVIIFDDVVNAIDTDHRSNIIDLFFSDPYLRRTQMIVTTHDRLFWERFCIISERHAQSDQHSSCVLTYTNKGILTVDHAGGFQEKIHRALGVYDIRQALIYCRIWFESMVLEYCIENGVSITAQFGKSQLKKSTYLQISLESTFLLVVPYISYDLTHFNIIKNDLVNWSGQNQEHHAFDEGSLNFVHSKTSKEVTKIYDAIRLLECQLFPEKKQKSCQSMLNDLNARIENGSKRIAELERAPLDVQQAHTQRHEALKKRAAELSQELNYIQTCLAAK